MIKYPIKKERYPDTSIPPEECNVRFHLVTRRLLLNTHAQGICTGILIDLLLGMTRWWTGQNETMIQQTWTRVPAKDMVNAFRRMEKTLKAGDPAFVCMNECVEVVPER